MELIIFIIVVGVIFSNLNKQRKASSNRDEPREVAGQGAAPHAHGTPDGDAPADTQSVRAPAAAFHAAARAHGSG